MSKIGVGIITVGVRELRPYLLEDGAMFHVERDKGSGIAPTRNRCLAALYDAGCSHFFMFDDDCWPTMRGWERYFLEGHEASGSGFIGLPEVFKGRHLETRGEVSHWENVVGCFSSQTRALVDAIGGWNTAYDTYGYEDTGRNMRVKRSGLGGAPDRYVSLLRASAYIHSADVFAEHPPAHLTREQKEAFIARNKPVYDRELRSTQQFYPFQP